MRLLLLSLRLAWRQLRSGQLVPMALSVAVVTAVTAAMAGVVQRLQAGVVAEAAQVLAADFSVQSADSGVWALGAGLRGQIEGLRVSKAASSNSMMFSRQGRQLVSVKAVDSAYPLLGPGGRGATPLCRSRARGLRPAPRRGLAGIAPVQPPAGPDRRHGRAGRCAAARHRGAGARARPASAAWAASPPG